MANTDQENEEGLQEKLVQVNRVAKVVKVEEFLVLQL